MYIIDTNIFIDSHRLHKLMENEQFLAWLLSLAKNQMITMPTEVFDELCVGNDEVVQWVKANKELLVTTSHEYMDFLPHVLQRYNTDGSIDEVLLKKIQTDACAIAHALSVNGTVVTSESPNKATAPHNKKIPNICQELKIDCITLPKFMWLMRQTMPE